MKIETVSNVFNVVLNKKNYQIEMIHESERDRRSFNFQFKSYRCRAFEIIHENELLIPLKQFRIIYDRNDKVYGAWTGDVIRDEVRILREDIASLFSNGVLKLAI